MKEKPLRSDRSNRNNQKRITIKIQCIVVHCYLLNAGNL